MSTIPDPQPIITDPLLFFTHEPNTSINKSLSLTDIMLNEDIIIEAIHELSPNSAAGPDCVPSSLLVNCATELALCYCLFFLTLFPVELSQNLGRGLLLFRFTSLAIKLSQVIIIQFP